MPGKYASQTTVSVQSSKQEIETLLTRYGADQFIQGWDVHQAAIGFRIEGRQVRILLPLPEHTAREITHTEQGKLRLLSAQTAAYEQACRQSFRALVLVIKAKLEAISAGISTIEREFLSDIVLPDGTTFGQWARPQLESAYSTRKMPALLPGLEEGDS